MFRSTRRANGAGLPAAIDIAPLIDVVFILLLFFLVSASFVQEAGIAVERPEATTAAALAPESLRVAIAASGAVYTGGEPVSLTELRGRVGAFLGQAPRGTVVLIPDERVPSGRLVAVMDAARAAGAERLAVATREPRRP